MENNFTIILTRLLANFKRRQLTEFLENAELLGYSLTEAINLLRTLQQGGWRHDL